MVVDSKLLKVEFDGAVKASFEGSPVKAVQRGGLAVINCSNCEESFFLEARHGDYLSITGDGYLTLNGTVYE
jgi:hypothetical protein